MISRSRKTVDHQSVLHAMKRVLIVLTAAFFMTLLTSCWRTGNYERAYFTKRGEIYLVEMKGRRLLLAHDPISAGRTYEETLTLELPRIEGVIDGVEIPTQTGHLGYAGRIEIAKRRMKVDLYYDGSDRHPTPWNGKYTLAQKAAGE
jgi:hypothetical protein